MQVGPYIRAKIHTKTYIYLTHLIRLPFSL
uniref:Uncharacterized protein n=1 Tax=Arundo donax TaxID=35708 RepID=A0A0A9A5A1_ARUDO